MTPDFKIVPQWVITFCCVAPSCALLGVSCATVLGYHIGPAVFIALGILCCKTLTMLLCPRPLRPQQKFLD